MIKTFLLTTIAACGFALAQTTQPFDGSPWNLSTGNLSVAYIQASRIGAFPRPDFIEPPPSVESLKKLKAKGLVAYEDYVAWGAVEREPGKWDWRQHDAMCEAIHAAGLKYVVYTWVHFPPVWLRDQQKSNRTLMRCLEHDQETNYLSIFDPKTIEHYDHFYKALAEHFGDKIDGVYACILGPYGEGNYPLRVPDWINMGHCHEGYWCGDEFVRKAFTAPPNPDALPQTREDRRRKVDFITWYHQALIDFAEKSVQTTLKYFPKEKVRTKPGGNAGGVNPIRWGTYCPAYAKMAAKYGIVLQPADWFGACFGDKWVSTAYHFYGVPLSTEPAGGLDHAGFVKSLFSDIDCGVNQIFTYDFDQHAADLQQYVHLVTGRSGETEIAVLCPTTLYRLGSDLSPTIKAADRLRDLANFDVLDELLIADEALKPERYKLLLIFQGDFIDQPILDTLRAYLAAGGQILVAGEKPIQNLDGVDWKPPGKLTYAGGEIIARLKDFATANRLKGYDAVKDGVWTARGAETILFNTTDKPVTAQGAEIGADQIRSITQHAISLAPDGRGFVSTSDQSAFSPWGFNYDRDFKMRLLEDYWEKEWDTVEEDFREMKDLGGNVVRIHLQFGKFMDAPDKPNDANLARLAQLVRFANQIGLQLDVTGLACYRKKDVPAWYDALSEAKRWDAQANFWEAIARTCADLPGVFCYDLINEPIVPGDKQPDGQWLHPNELAGFHYVQFIAIDPAGRDRNEIARQWTRRMTAAIRKHDPRRLITIGMLPEVGSGFDPAKLAAELDFIAVHVYPERKDLAKADRTLREFHIAGKPLVLEEFFPINADAADLTKFLSRNSELIDGCVSFYWGRTPDDLAATKDVGDAITGAWLTEFGRLMQDRSAAPGSARGSSQSARP